MAMHAPPGGGQRFETGAATLAAGYPAAAPFALAQGLPSVCYNVMDIGLRLYTALPPVARAAADAFDAWGHAALGSPELRLVVLAQDEKEAGSLPAQPQIRAAGPTLQVALGESGAYSNRHMGFAVAKVTGALCLRQDLLREWFVECLGFHLVSGRLPGIVHAAAVGDGPRTVLLTGAAGAGKSTFALACVRSGLKLLADDAVYSGRADRPLTVWGNPWRMSVLPDVARHFPDLLRAFAMASCDGRGKLRVRTRDVNADGALTRGDVSGVLLLRRVPGARSQVTKAEPGGIRAALTGLNGDPPVDRAAVERAAERFARTRTGVLEVGKNLDAAVRAVLAWLAE